MAIQDNNQNDSGKAQNNDAGNSESHGVEPLKTRDDKREHDIDANKSISQMREEADLQHSEKPKDQPVVQENGPEDDAMNYQSDRDHGSFNPKNI